MKGNLLRPQPSNALVRLHWSPAARKLTSSSRIDWVHLCVNNPIPPISGGSYNYLLWQLVTTRRYRDLVIADYFHECFGRVQGTQAPIIYLELPRRWRKRLNIIRDHSLLFRNRLDPRTLLLHKFASIVKQVDSPNILVWGAIKTLPWLRRLLPNRHITFAQRHYDYPLSHSYYDYCDTVIMQTRGQVRQGFHRLQRLNPFVVVIPNGVELEIFTPAAANEKQSLRQKYGIPIERFVVLFPSKLAPYKGTRYLLRWIEHCVDDAPELFFLVVGDMHHSMPSFHKNESEKLLGTYSNVQWLRGLPRHQMPEVYQLADACLMPGLWREGFSMALCEALASGLPVIASNGGSYPEILKHGINGILCSQEKLFCEGLQAMRNLATDPNLVQRIGRNARVYAESRLSREKVLTNFDKFLNGDHLSIDEDLSMPYELIER